MNVDTTQTKNLTGFLRDHVWSQIEKHYMQVEVLLLWNGLDDCTEILKYPFLLQALGKLMNESFDSCRDLYECSCDELNELVTVCR